MIHKAKIENGIILLLEGLGLDPENQHLVKTPERVSRMWAETLAAGYDKDVKRILDVQFDDDYNEMVVVKDIPFMSTCSHHLVPFVGTAKIGYIPNGKVTGLSKLARVLDVFAQRLQVQERLTRQVANAINEALEPKGVGVVLSAEHMCMTHRGVKKPGSTTITSCLLGEMMDSAKTRSEFLQF